MLFRTACRTRQKHCSPRAKSVCAQLLHAACLLCSLLVSGIAYADARISIVDDPRGYIEVVGLFEDGSEYDKRISQDTFFSGWYSRRDGYVGCAQFRIEKGSVCGETDGESAEVDILAMNVMYDKQLEACIRQYADDFNVYYHCPDQTLPEPSCKPKDTGDGWKYAECEVISDQMIAQLFSVGIGVDILNLQAQKEAVEKFNSGYRSDPSKVPYELLGGSETLVRLILSNCCSDGTPGFAILDRLAEEKAQEAMQEVEDQAVETEQIEQTIEQPQVTQPVHMQENTQSAPSEPRAFPHRKVRLIAMTSAVLIILIVFLVVGTAYMRSRNLA